MAGSAEAMQWSTPFTFTSTMRSQSSRWISLTGEVGMMPALFTRMSAGPNSAAARSTSANTASRSATSVATASARPPSRPIRATSSSRRPARRAATATTAPASASAMAVARPIPLDAPVTMATLPARDADT